MLDKYKNNYYNIVEDIKDDIGLEINQDVYDFGKNLKESNETKNVMTLEDAKNWKDELKKKIKAPYVDVEISVLGGRDRPSIMLLISLDNKKDWPNGYVENSNYMRFSIDSNGSIEQFNLSHRLDKKFRKSKFKNLDDIVKKINTYIDKVGIKESTNLKEASVNFKSKETMMAAKMLIGYLVNTGKKHDFMTGKFISLKDIPKTSKSQLLFDELPNLESMGLIKMGKKNNGFSIDDYQTWDLIFSKIKESTNLKED